MNSLNKLSSSVYYSQFNTFIHSKQKLKWSYTVSSKQSTTTAENACVLTDITMLSIELRYTSFAEWGYGISDYYNNDAEKKILEKEGLKGQEGYKCQAICLFSVTWLWMINYETYLYIFDAKLRHI